MKKYCFIITILACLQWNEAVAQSCTGSLGDPTAKITFGTAADPTPPLGASASAYEYTNDGCPGKGQYTFGSRVFACFNTSWHTLNSDYTADDFDGLYMLVNAAEKTGAVYTSVINGLCPSTNYEVSMWIANLLKPGICTGSSILPSFTIQVETLSGDVLVSYATASILVTSQLDWKKFATFFQTPANVTSVIIKVINKAIVTTECGNVFAMDDITFRPCGPSVNALITSNNSANINICEGDTTTFVLQGNYSPGYSTPAFQWQVSTDYGVSWSDINGATKPAYIRKPTVLGIYYYRLGMAESVNISSLSCRVYSKPVTIYFSPHPFVQITNYVYGCYGARVVLFAAGGSKYEWSGPNNFSSTDEGPIIPEVKFTDAGKYTVTVTTDRGCTGSASTDLVIYPAAHATIGPDVSICEGRTATLSAGGGNAYEWTPANVLSDNRVANPIANPADTTQFLVKVTNDYGCSDYAYVKVNVWKKPFASAGPDLKTRLGVPVTFNGGAAGSDVSYAWTPATFMENANALRAVANPPVTTTFTLHVTSNKGCGTATDDMFLKVYDKVIIPNAFSPNGDGINDTWYIEPLDLFFDAELKIFDRNGQPVFSHKGVYTPWDGKRNGKPLPIGVYYYVLDLKIKNEKPLTGTLTILR